MHNILSMRWTEGWGGVAHFVLRVATGPVASPLERLLTQLRGLFGR